MTLTLERAGRLCNNKSIVDSLIGLNLIATTEKSNINVVTFMKYARALTIPSSVVYSKPTSRIFIIDNDAFVLQLTDPIVPARTPFRGTCISLVDFA